MAIVLVYIIILVFIIRLYQKSTNGFYQSKKRLDGKVAIVTGGTGGMGLEIAKDLAKRGARVIIASSFEKNGVTAKKLIKDSTGKDVVFKLLDLGSLDSVRKFATDILKTEDRLDLLINNAGVGPIADRLTADGMHIIMQINYYGHFLLTLLLLPLLKNTGISSDPSRVVNTSSVSHWVATLAFDEIDQSRRWFYIRIYATSKLAGMLFAQEITKKLEGSCVVVNSVDPGAVGTGFFNSFGLILGTITGPLLKFTFKTPLEGAQTALHVALDEDAGKVSGEFFKNCKLDRGRPAAYDKELAKKLWDQSVRLVKLSKDEMMQCLKG